MLSKVTVGSKVAFPENTGERLYMIPFTKTSIPDVLSRWKDTISAMLSGIDTDEEMYLTVDQKDVKAGHTQRSGGVHIDGNWEHSRWDTGGGGRWNTRNLERGGIILATDCYGANIYVGEVEGRPAERGDCSHLDLSTTDKITMEDNTVYIGNVTMLHEAVPVSVDTERTLVRITLPSTYAA